MKKCLEVLSEQHPPPLVPKPNDEADTWGKSAKSRVRLFTSRYGEMFAHDFMDATTQFMMNYEKQQRLIAVPQVQHLPETS